MDETKTFKQIEEMLSTRGIEFTPQMQFQYWHDPLVHALFHIVLELMENKNNEK
jgi:hypothetical protein